MDYTTLGKFTLTICPCCEKIFKVKAEPAKAFEILHNKARLHFRNNKKCQAYMDALPKFSDLVGILKESDESK